MPKNQSLTPCWAGPAECAGCWGSEACWDRILENILGKNLRCNEDRRSNLIESSARSSPVGRRIRPALLYALADLRVQVWWDALLHKK